MRSLRPAHRPLFSSPSSTLLFSAAALPPSVPVSREESEDSQDTPLTTTSFTTHGGGGRVARCLDFPLFDRLLKTHHSLRPLQQVHALLATGGLLRHPHLGSQLILAYANLGFLHCSRVVFEEFNGSNSLLWNTMARVYTKNGCSGEAVELYSCMRRGGIPANNYTYPFVLKACAFSPMVSVGKSVHCDVIKTGFESDVFVEAALVDMYSKCGEIPHGRKLFDGMLERDLVSWTAMITAYEQSEKPKESLLLFHQMQEEGFVADRVTSITVASAVAQLGDTRTARSLHGFIIRNSFLADVAVGNAVISMFAKCGDVKLARLVFDAMDERDGISWNSMLSGYAQNGHASEALALFDQMLFSGPEPNPVTLLVVVSACAHLGSLHLARQLHSFVISSNMEVNMMLWNAIMDMYAKCGDLDTAVGLFSVGLDGRRDVNSWNVMISGFGMHGRGREALKLFQDMQEEGVLPNHITFTSLLSACSHAGLIQEGKEAFNDMGSKFMIAPMAKHYVCVVDMLGRAGRLEEARDLIAQMPIGPNDAVWGALLGACRIHGNRELGEFAAKRLFHLEPGHSGYYVLMSNVYAASTKWDEVGKLRDTMKSRGLRKPAAFSVIEIGREVHGFHTADLCHPDHAEIYRKIESLVEEMKVAGYEPDVACVLHDVEEEDKAQILNLHSEKLAVAYGIMKVEAGRPIQVTKNLRICNDCHCAFKFLSQICGRRIVVRDANRFHHFSEGACSCRDYW
ncbi:hypothetical protein Taro_018677 [Colocasia esculenta]|uniref:DYW domain-containing protein n=1 Tax=Colocasia esculenta TaxID=4460 RepID=A0A843URN5_COLES|nr:hypothetical protein [Colocasia esculenta]